MRAIAVVSLFLMVISTAEAAQRRPRNRVIPSPPSSPPVSRSWRPTRRQWYGALVAAALGGVAWWEGTAESRDRWRKIAALASLQQTPVPLLPADPDAVKALPVIAAKGRRAGIVVHGLQFAFCRECSLRAEDLEERAKKGEFVPLRDMKRFYSAKE